MQIIYAAPFVLLSLVGFLACLIFRPLRGFALSSLIAPVAFGVCSIVGWFTFAIIGGMVAKGGLGPATGIHGWIEGLIFYLLPGIMGSWFAVFVVTSLERAFLRTERSRREALRVQATVVAFPCGFVVTFAGIEQWRGFLAFVSPTIDFVGALVGGILISAFAFVATRRIILSRDSQAAC